MLILLAVEDPSVLEKIFLVLLGGTLGWLATLVTNRISSNADFANRFRLEMEYDRYCDLWEKLFRLRRSVADLHGSLEGRRYVSHKEEIDQAYNAYQQAVRNGEPFMSKSVYDPARAIVMLSIRIINNCDKILELEQHSDRETTADKCIALDHDSDAKIQEIESLFENVSAAIRKRVTPAV
jgi:hypothetical protein